MPFLWRFILIWRTAMAKKTIGPKIKDFRKKNKITQEALAKSLGYSGKSVISHIEKGDADMTYEKLCLFLKTYNVDPNDLFDTGKKINRQPLAKKDTKRAIVYIHGLHGSYEEAKNYAFLNDQFDVIGLDYQDGNPWEVGPLLKEKFVELIKPYDEVFIIANSIGAFYACEYLFDCHIERAFFISPIVSMFQNIVDLMMMYDIKDSELRDSQFIELDDGTVLSYDFYQHVANEENKWNVPTDILYGAYDEIVYSGSMLEFLENHPSARLTVKSEGEHYFETEEDQEFIKNWILSLL